MKSVLVQFYQIYLLSLFKYIDSMSNTYVGYTLLRNSQQVGPLLYYSNRWGPFFIISTGGAPSLLFQQVGPLLYYFNRWAPLLFQQVGPLLYYFNGWAPFFIISTGGVPSLLFQRVGSLLYNFNGWGPFFINGCIGLLLYYFKGCIGLCSFVLTFRYSLTFALTIAKLYIFKFKFSKFVWSFREPLSQIYPRSALAIPGFALG